MNKTNFNLCIISLILIFFPISSSGNTPQNVFYTLEKGKIEFRSLAPNGSSSSIKLVNFEGKEFELADPPLLSSDDFEGISRSGEDIIIYIKKNSWAKVRKVTSENINEQLAIVINNKVSSAPVVREPLSRVLYISGHGTTHKDFKQLFNGFTQAQKPEYLDDQEVYIKFMETWVAENPKDFSALQELALLYITEPDGSINLESLKPEQCVKSIPLLKKLIKQKPTEIYHYLNLSQCYLASSDYSSAISVIESSIPYYPEDQKWHPYSGIGLIYIMDGSYDKALAILEKSKIMLQNTKMLPQGMTLEAAQMFFSVAPGPDGKKINFETLDELENYLKKDAMDRIEEIILQAKEGKNKRLTNKD